MSGSIEKVNPRAVISALMGFKERGASVLSYILMRQEGKPVPPSEIQKALNISPSNLSHSGRSLENLGLIKRSPDGYTPNMGVIINVLLSVVVDLVKRVEELEKETEKKQG
ncbi:MAG: helix-turn-helix domain-containing protein [Candidatus Jordarchaeales archaeon]|nr:helix-turn-helix transcriptional regulator [Candidatus Jordarchaeia archaeon]